MRFTLTAERRLVEPYVVAIEQHLTSLPGTIPGEVLGTTLRYYIYTVLSQYMYHVHSHVMAPPNIEYLMDEFLWGHHIPPEERQNTLEYLAAHLANAHIALRPTMQQMVGHLEGYGEEIDDVFISFGNVSREENKKIMVVVVETAPVDAELIEPQMMAWHHHRRVTAGGYEGVL